MEGTLDIYEANLEIKNLQILKQELIQIRDDLDKQILSNLINICINGDGTLNYSDLEGLTTSKPSTGHYQINLNDLLEHIPLIVFLTVVNPEYSLTSYQITDVTSDNIFIYTYRWSDGEALDINKIYLQIK